LISRLLGGILDEIKIELDEQLISRLLGGIRGKSDEINLVVLDKPPTRRDTSQGEPDEKHSH